MQQLERRESVGMTLMEPRLVSGAASILLDSLVFNNMFDVYVFLTPENLSKLS